MKQFKIVPLSWEYAKQIRETKIDAFGHKVIEQLATGRGPCRVSLKPFEVGTDVRLLLSHNPFLIDNASNQPGPIFINKKDVEPYADMYRFTPEIKLDKARFHLTLIGYDLLQMMKISQLVGDDDVDELIVKIFDQNPEIEYLHARSAEACCIYVQLKECRKYSCRFIQYRFYFCCTFSIFQLRSAYHLANNFQIE